VGGVQNEGIQLRRRLGAASLDKEDCMNMGNRTNRGEAEQGRRKKVLLVAKKVLQKKGGSAAKA